MSLRLTVAIPCPKLRALGHVDGNEPLNDRQPVLGRKVAGLRVVFGALPVRVVTGIVPTDGKASLVVRRTEVELFAIGQ